MNKSTQIKKTTIRNTTISFLFTMLLISFFGIQNTNAGINDLESLPEMAIAAPTAQPASNVTSTSFRANWTSVTGAIGYKLYVARKVIIMGNVQWMFVEGYNGLLVGGTNRTVSGLTPGNTYKYYLIAGSATEMSDPSNEIEVTLIPPAPAATEATNRTTDSFTANWNASTGATSYKLYVEMNFLGLAWTHVSGYENGKVVSGTSHTISPLLHATEHRYWVKAVNANGESDNSNIVYLNTKLTPTTTNAAYNISSTSFTASWNASTGATSYLLRVSRDSDQNIIINDLEVEGTLHTVTWLNPGAGYRYSVRAKRDAHISDLSNWTLVTTLPATPVAKAATNISSTSFQANWDAAAGATAYKLSVWEKNGLAWVPGYQDKVVTGTSEVITGLDPLTEYRYRLKAVNSSSESLYSATIDVTTAPAPPVAMPATNITSTSFKANWQAYTASTHYDLYVYWKRTAIAVTWRVVEGYDGVAVTGLEKTVTGLTPGTHYKYFIRARQGSTGESEPSNEVLVNTLTLIPYH